MSVPTLQDELDTWNLALNRKAAPQMQRLLPSRLYVHTVLCMTSFNPFPPEIERSWVRRRGQQIATRTGCTQGIGEARAMCELQKLREA